MTTACRNIHINDIQCKFADLAYKHAQALSLGRVCKERELYIKIISAYLPILYCYKTFTSTVTYAYNFVFSKSNDDSTTITIVIGTDTFTYTGTGTTLEIAQHFLDEILASTDYDFQGFLHQGALYIYSYDTDLSFSTTTTVTDVDDIVVTATTTVTNVDDIVVTTNMEDTYESILDIWNCITAEQVCCIINNAKKLTGQCSC